MYLEITSDFDISIICQDMQDVDLGKRGDKRNIRKVLMVLFFHNEKKGGLVYISNNLNIKSVKAC